MDTMPRDDILPPMPLRVSILLLLATVSFGCANTLETGYKPQSLGASAAVRRSYYAAPFTPEAQAAGQGRDQELESRRPRPGY